MSGEFIAFFVFALFAIGGAVLMLSFTKVVHMVVALAFTFLSIGGIYVLLQAEFIAFVQVLIYSGAITILMLFGIMMTRHNDVEKEKSGRAHRLLAFIGAAALFGMIYYAIRQTSWSGESANFTENNTKAIGDLLYHQYVIPFEIVSVLLTVALIGAILLAKREEEQQ